MTIARPRAATGATARASLVLGALVLAAAPDAAADGEQTPMFGGAVVGGRGPDPHADLAGVQLEVAWWHGRVGLAAEGSMHWHLGGAGGRAATLGGSARLRVLEGMLPALLEPRDVEYGLELHGILERAWWDGDLPDGSPVRRGLGVALRLRGGSDDFSLLLAESRLFVRVLTAHPTARDAVAISRTMEPATAGEPRELTIVIGLGAAFGAGEPRYLERFRLRPPPIELPRRP